MPRFVTSEIASRVFRELTLDPTQRESGGDTFTLKIEVPVPYEDVVEFRAAKLIARRLPLKQITGSGKPGYKYEDGAVVFKTTAQLAINEPPFTIDIELPGPRQNIEGALVVIADTIEGVIRHYLDRVDREGL